MMTEPETAPLFQIITISRDNLAGLEKTYGSLKSQTEQAFRWIIIDGGSTDGTQSFLKSLPDGIDWRSEKDSGLYAAMNKGIKRLTACDSLVLFLNAGDRLADDSILAQIRQHAFASDNRSRGYADFVYGDAMEALRDGTSFVKRAKPNHSCINGMFTHHQAMLYNARRLKEFNILYDTEFKIAADYDFTLGYLSAVHTLPDPEICYIDRPVCYFEHGGLSQQQWEQGRKEQARIRRRYSRSSLFTAGRIALRQIGGNVVRQHFPGLYKFLRSAGG